ncbi:MAG: transposase [Planctomycetaceae bacterium]|nr:transposase [Planctomycetaceae bacterium]
MSAAIAQEAREAIEAVGDELRFLPPYTPDLNPIEQAFSKFKWPVCSAGERTEEGLWNLCVQLVERITPEESLNYIQHAGYRDE